MPWSLQLAGDAADVLAAVPVNINRLLASAAQADVEQITSVGEILEKDLATYSGPIAVTAAGIGDRNLMIQVSVIPGYVYPSQGDAPVPQPAPQMASAPS
jgi:hypothetical protein